MNLNAPLLLETALLMLAAFLLGAVIGTLARLLLARPKPASRPAEAPAAAAVTPAAEKAPDLVTAPAIAPLKVADPAPLPGPAPVATVATLAPSAPAAAAVGAEAAMMPIAMPSAPAFAPIAPTRVAGETVSGRHIDNPEHPHAASLDDARAVPAAQIDASPAAPADAPPTAPTEPPETPAAAAAEAPVEPANVGVEPKTAAPEIVEVVGVVPADPAEEAESRLPVEDRIEPQLAVETAAVTDGPVEIAAELQDVIETPDADPVPDVAAEPPLVEPVYEQSQDAEERNAEESGTDDPDIAQSPPAEVEAGRVAAHDDEMAAMRAIEGGWHPKSSVTRAPADLPEGVSPADAAATDAAVASAGVAVASATALAESVLQELSPARAPRPTGGFGRPPGLPAPREGGKDDFAAIKGVSPAIESSLNGLGIYHYDQIADWDQKAVVWLESHFGFKGRISRERWQDQARTLVRGKMPVARSLRR